MAPTSERQLGQQCGDEVGHDTRHDGTEKTVTNVIDNSRIIPDHPQKLLLADDEHLVASGLANSLEELGYTVVGPASDGEQAVELCRSEKPDMALLDIRMGRTSGLDAAEVLFHQLGTPVIIFSAYSDEKYIQTGARIGVFNYLLKPLPKEQLKAAISVAWGRYLAWTEQSAQIDKLRTRLEERKIIEQAKWIIVQRNSVTEPEAMKMLQVKARNSRRHLVDIARGVLESDSLLGG